MILGQVAPRVGAWIETLRPFAKWLQIMSHPVWVRGLKQNSSILWPSSCWSHPVWVRGLKRFIRGFVRNFVMSHPVWVRGLKLE